MQRAVRNYDKNGVQRSFKVHFQLALKLLYRTLSIYRHAEVGLEFPERNVDL